MLIRGYLPRIRVRPFSSELTLKSDLLHGGFELLEIADTTGYQCWPTKTKTFLTFVTIRVSGYTHQRFCCLLEGTLVYGGAEEQKSLPFYRTFKLS